MAKTTKSVSNTASAPAASGGALNACLVKRDPNDVLAQKGDIEKLIGLPFLFFQSDGERVTGEFTDPARPNRQVIGYYRGKEHDISIEKSIELFERFGGTYSIHERRFVWPCGKSAPYRQGKKNGVPTILNTVFSDEHLGEMKYLLAVKSGAIPKTKRVSVRAPKPNAAAVATPAAAPPAPVVTVPRAKPATKAKVAATKKAWIALAEGEGGA